MTDLQEQQSLLLCPFPGGGGSFSLVENKDHQENMDEKVDLTVYPVVVLFVE